VAIGGSTNAGTTGGTTTAQGAYAIAIGYGAIATASGSKALIKIGSTNNYYYMDGSG
jgi:hypothetical protein